MDSNVHRLLYLVSYSLLSDCSSLKFKMQISKRILRQRKCVVIESVSMFFGKQKFGEFSSCEYSFIKWTYLNYIQTNKKSDNTVLPLLVSSAFGKIVRNVKYSSSETIYSSTLFEIYSQPVLRFVGKINITMIIVSMCKQNRWIIMMERRRLWITNHDVSKSFRNEIVLNLLLFNFQRNLFYRLFARIQRWQTVDRW